MNTLVFCLGVIAAMVLVLLVALVVMVVVVLRLSKRVSHQDSILIESERNSTLIVSNIERNITEGIRDVTLKIEKQGDETDRKFDDVYRTLNDEVQSALSAAKSYTDGRIDKALNKAS